MAKKIYVIAGEASGDLHGAHLIEHLKKMASAPIEIYGVGGGQIRQTGALEFVDLARIHTTGITDALKKLPQYRRAAAEILAKIKRVRPDVVVVIDNPGFNLHLAARIHALGIPLIYYIAPQVWAWAPKRIEKIKRYFQKVLVVFEFEKKLYEERGIPVAWVGHPLKDRIRTAWTRPAEKTVCLLPGSRKGEIKILFPVFAQAAQRMIRAVPQLRFSLVKSPTLPRSYYERLLENLGIPVTLVEQNAYEAIQKSELAIVCSGTATLECALLGTPMIISNRATFLTYLAAKWLIRVPYLGMPNLVLGEMKFPEFLQYRATPKNIAEEALRILKDPGLKDQMRLDLKRVSEKLGEPGATERAARKILEFLENKNPTPTGR